MYISRAEAYLNMKEILDNLLEQIEKMKLLGISFTNRHEDNKYLKLIKNIEEEIKINLISIEDLKKPFLLFIVGCGNYGKSTLINVLLKDKIVETADLPNTWKLDIFHLSKSEKMEMVLKDKSKSSYKIHKGNKILKQEGEKYRASKKRISQELKGYRKNNDLQKDKLLKVKKNFEDKYLYISDIVEVHYYLNNIGILNDFIIVDTPGLNQNLQKNTQDTMKYYYSRADGIIWLIDAQNIVSKRNNNLINDISEIDEIYGENKNIIGVVNKMDIIEQNGIESIKKVKSKVKEMYKDNFRDIIFISAKKGLEGLITNNKEKVIESNIIELYNSIEKNFKKFSEESQIKSKKINLTIMKDKLNKLLESYKRDLYKDISRYNEAEYELKEKNLALADYIKENLYSLKNKSYLEEDNALGDLKEDIKKIEDICIKSIDKIYNSLIITSNISNRQHEKILNTNMSFTKSKFLVAIMTSQECMHENYKSTCDRKHIIYNISYRNSKENAKYKYVSKYTIIRAIENISNEILQHLNEKIYEINISINKLRNESFKDYHINYYKTRELISYLDNIEYILNNMG